VDRGTMVLLPFSDSVQLLLIPDCLLLCFYLCPWHALRKQRLESTWLPF
jgi:hypothetical protein